MVGDSAGEAEGMAGSDGASTWSGFEVMCSALECADWRIADISIDVDAEDEGEARGKGKGPLQYTLQYKISFEQPPPRQEAQPKGRKGEAYPRCTLLVEESLPEGAVPDETEPDCEWGATGSGSGTPKDVHASLREAIRRASSAPTASSGMGPGLGAGHAHQYAHGQHGHLQQSLRGASKSSQSDGMNGGPHWSPEPHLLPRLSSRLSGSNSCSGSGSCSGTSESCPCSACDIGAASSGASSSADACAQKARGSLPLATAMPNAQNSRLDSALLADALHGLFGCHSPSKAGGSSGAVQGHCRDSPGALGKPPRWAKGKEPLAERLVARCRSAVVSREHSLSGKDCLESGGGGSNGSSVQGGSPRVSLEAPKSEGRAGSSAGGPGSGGLASVAGAEDDDEGVPRLVLTSRRSASTPCNVALEGREDEVRSRRKSRRGGGGAQDLSQWGELYGA